MFFSTHRYCLDPNTTNRIFQAHLYLKTPIFPSPDIKTITSLGREAAPGFVIRLLYHLWNHRKTISPHKYIIVFTKPRISFSIQSDPQFTSNTLMHCWWVVGKNKSKYGNLLIAIRVYLQRCHFVLFD